MTDSPEHAESRKKTTRMILKNTGFITAGTFVLKGINFLFGIYVVRQLGDTRFGQYSIVLAFVGIFQIMAELGMSQYVMREMARDRKNIRLYFWNLVALRLILALLGMAVIPVAAHYSGYSPALVLGILVYTSGFILSAFAAPLGSVLSADERLGQNTAINIISQITFMIFGTIFLLGGLGYVWLIVASLISIVPRIVISALTIRRLHISDMPIQIDVKLWPHIIRSGLPFGIISLMISIALSIDTVMLSWYESEAAVGWYNVAYNLVFAVMIVFNGFKEAIVPSLSKIFVSDPRQVDRWYFGSVKMIMLLSLPITIGGMIIAFPLIRFLYTDEFMPSALALQILIWDVPLIMFASFCGNMTTVIGEERSAARINTVNTIANVGLNLLFIPMFGLVGAALITVTTDLISSLQFHMLLGRKLNLPNVTGVLLRTIAAALIMGVPIYLLVRFVSGWQLFLLMGLGALIYLGLIIAFRLVGPDEWSVVSKVLRRIGAFRRVRPKEAG